jgi:hypothetical protein
MKRITYFAFPLLVLVAVLFAVSLINARSVADGFMKGVDGQWVRRQTIFYPYRTFAEFRGPAWLFYYESRAFPKSPPAGIPVGLLGHMVNRLITLGFVRESAIPRLPSDVTPVSRDPAWSPWTKPSSFTLESTRNGLKP